MTGRPSQKDKCALGSPRSTLGRSTPQGLASANDYTRRGRTSIGTLPLAVIGLLDELEVRMLMRADGVDAQQLLASLAAISSWLKYRRQQAATSVADVVTGSDGF